MICGRSHRMGEIEQGQGSAEGEDRGKGREAPALRYGALPSLRAGWRIGFGTGPGWLVEAMEKLQGQQTSGASTISQHAALAALTGPQDFIAQSRAVFQRRRDAVVAALNQAPGLQCQVPQGAFYAFASCEGLMGSTTPAGTQLGSDEDVVNALLDEAGVATVHGSAFGLGPYVRLAYALDDASLHTACQSIQVFCRSLSR